jgi:hypothetical protein
VIAHAVTGETLVLMHLTPFDHTVEPSLRGELTREMWYELLDVRI